MTRPQSLLNILKTGTAGEHKIALYSGLFDGEAYTTVGEVVAQGYEAGGKSVTPTYGKTRDGAYLTYADACIWKNSTIAARSALIYSVNSGLTLHIVDFGKQITSTNDSFTLEPSKDPLIAWVNS